MNKLIARTKIKREKGFVYYCGTENGFLTINKAWKVKKDKEVINETTKK